MEPPIHTEYFLSGGAMILIFMLLGARAVISFCILSAITWVHAGASGENGVGVQILTDINVALHDAVVCGSHGYASGFHTWGQRPVKWSCQIKVAQ